MADGWFPRLNGRGDVVSGSKTLWVNGEQLLDRHGKVVLGLQPAWLTDDVVFFKGIDDLPYSMSLVGKEPMRLSAATGVIYDAGGGEWARSTTPLAVSVDPSSGKVAREIEHNGNGNDHSIEVDGQVVVSHQPVGRPKLRDGLLAYVRSEREVFVGAANATVFQGWHGIVVPVMAGTQQWVLVQTNEDLRLYPVGKKQGFIVRTGSDQNFNPDVRYLKGRFEVRWNTGNGKLGQISFSPNDVKENVGQPFKRPTTPVDPPKEEKPKEPKEPTDMIDDKKAEAIVRAERAKYGSMARHEIDDFLRNVARRLNEEKVSDKPFGVLKKDSGSQCDGYSCDIICQGNGDDQKQWDVLVDGDPGGRQEPTWEGPLKKIVVRPCEVVEGEAEPEPDPVDQHEYDGGDNDTGTCDICGERRDSEVHIQKDDEEEEPSELERVFIFLQNQIDNLKQSDRVKAKDIAELQSQVEELKAQLSSVATVAATAVEELAKLPKLKVKENYWHSHELVAE